MYGKKTTTKNTLEYRIEKINTLIKRYCFRVKNGITDKGLIEEIDRLKKLKTR
jgi:hypothetical protein